MKILKAIWSFISNNATKILGYAQTTIGVLAVADGVFTPAVLKYILLGSGLLTAWRGHANSARIASETPPGPQP